MIHNRRFYTTGNHDIQEEEIEMLDVSREDEIIVKTKLVGICRSDVDMYTGTFELPKEIQGHEGLGEVVAIGSNVTDVSIGDYVATNADNCFADYYRAPAGMYIKVPAPEPKYILEPVACAFNILQQAEAVLDAYIRTPKNILIIGSGFLAKIIASVISTKASANLLVVVGSANKDFFRERNISQTDICSVFDRLEPHTKFDLIIDLSSKTDMKYLIDEAISQAGIYIIGTKKDDALPQNYESALWKSVTFLCPSPRGAIPFIISMNSALEFVSDPNNDWIADGWTHNYYRNNVQAGFDEAIDRDSGYGRGYINYEAE